jgi:hypothetical protein
MSPGMEEKQKDEDWPRLGMLIASVSHTKEVANLGKNIGNGKLKG